MKHLIYLSLIFLISINVNAQQDFDGINYQAVLRSDEGDILANKELDLQIELYSLDNTESFYTEIHHLTTNQYGLVNTIIGKGEKVSGSMRNVPWETKDIFIKISKLSENGDLILLAENKLLAVPYAYHAGTADRLIQDDSRGGEDEANDFNYWRLGGNNIGLSPATHKYIGTNNMADFELYTNGEMRADFDGATGDLDLRANMLIEKNLTIMGNLKLFGDQLVLGNTTLERNVSIGEDLYTKGNFNLIGVGTFENPTQSTSPDDGAVVVYGGVGIGKQLNVGGITEVWDETQSTDPDNGSLVTNGGVGINLQLNVGGISHIWDDTQSTAIDNGAFIVNGGVGIGKQVNIGGITQVYDDTQSTATDNGALILVGGAGIAKQVNIGGITQVWNTTESTDNNNGSLIVDGGIGIASNTNIGGSIDVDQKATIHGITTVTDESESTMPKDGALIVTGGAGIGKNLNVGGSFALMGDLDVDGQGRFNSTEQSFNIYTGAIITAGGIGIAKNANVGENLSIIGETTAEGSVLITNTTPSTNIFTGALKVQGGTGILGNVNVGGTVTVGNRLTANNGIEIVGGPDGGEGSFENYPMQISGSSQGLAIKVNGSRNNSNNFISFWDESSGNIGRIEGETVPELGTTNNDYIFQRNLYIAESIFAGIQVGSATAAIIEESVDWAAAIASINACFGAGAVACPPIPSFNVSGPINEAAAVVDLIAQIGQFIILEIEFGGFVSLAESQIGVSYQSGAGDYAEWLPKNSMKEKFEPGDIIGVKGGKISKNITEAEQILVISHRPMILGNMQDEANQNAFEKVAFLGQVPVKVIGKVSKGDYIIPAGDGLGYGIGISPDDMTAEDYQKIVGVAWASNNPDKPGYVMTAVGLNGGDVSKLVVKQNETIVKQQNEINELKSQVNQINSALTSLLPEYNLAINNDVPVASVSVPSHHENILDEKGMEIERQIQREELENKLYMIKNSDRLLTVEKLEIGLELYKKQLIDEGINVDDHPFLSKCRKNPSFKNKLFEETVERVNDKIKAQLALFERELRKELKALDMLD